MTSIEPTETDDPPATTDARESAGGASTLAEVPPTCGIDAEDATIATAGGGGTIVTRPDVSLTSACTAGQAIRSRSA